MNNRNIDISLPLENPKKGVQLKSPTKKVGFVPHEPDRELAKTKKAQIRSHNIVGDNSWNDAEKIEAVKLYQMFFADKDKRDHKTAVNLMKVQKKDADSEKAAKKIVVQQHKTSQLELLNKRKLERIAVTKEAQQAMIEKQSPLRQTNYLLDKFENLKRDQKVSLSLTKSALSFNNNHQNLWNKDHTLDPKQLQMKFTPVSIKMQEDGIGRITEKIKNEKISKVVEKEAIKQSIKDQYEGARSKREQHKAYSDHFNTYDCSSPSQYRSRIQTLGNESIENNFENSIMKSREGGSPQRKESSNKPSVSNIMLKKGYYSNRLPGSKNDKSPTNLSTSIGGVHNPYLISPIKVTDDKNISEKYNKVTFSSDSSSKPNLRDVISSYSKYSKKEVITEKIGEEDQEYTDNQNKSLLRQERVLSSKLNNFGIKSIKCDSRFGRDRLSQSQNCEDGMDNSYAVKSYEEKLIDHHLHGNYLIINKIAQSQPLGTRAAKGRGNCPMKNLNSQIKSEREMYCGSDFKGMSLPKINGKLAYIENALNLELTKKSGWLQNRKLEIKQKE